MFSKFARRMSSTQGFPYVVIAETPNPIRQLEPEVLRQRAEAMLQTIIDYSHEQGLTAKKMKVEELFAASTLDL